MVTELTWYTKTDNGEFIEATSLATTTSSPLDSSHSVEAIYSGGLTLGSYLVPEAVYIADKTRYVGILSQSPNYILTLMECGGFVIAHGYTVYSSRRFKTDIHPLPGSLEKIKQLHGVSYVRKSSGKPEIGVVAEDVAKVAPELVA